MKQKKKKVLIIGNEVISSQILDIVKKSGIDVREVDFVTNNQEAVQSFLTNGSYEKIVQQRFSNPFDSDKISHFFKKRTLRCLVI